MKNFQKHFIKEWTIQLIRNYFIDLGFHEVETPTLMTSIPIEPNLYTFKTTWHQKNLDFYLATSPESSLKKLIAEGLGNCFAISKVFRDLEDIGPTHNLEFSMLEWYEMGFDYRHLAETTEKVVINIYHGIQEKLNIRTTNILNFQNHPIDLSPPWHRFTLSELFQKFAAIDLSKNLDTDSIIATAKTKNYNVDGITTWEPLYTQIFVNEIEPNLPLDKPVFIFDYPTQVSPLCEICPAAAEFSQRFEFYIGGWELGNGYTELTDADILEKNFQTETEFRRIHHLPLHPYDKDFVKANRHLPPCTGIGLGVDRLAMLFANTANIEDVLYFPTSSMI